MPRLIWDARLCTSIEHGPRQRQLTVNKYSSTCHTTLPTPLLKLSRNFGRVESPCIQANFLWIDWPTSKATLFLSSNSPLLGTAHPIWAISCPTGNYITARGWKFCLLSRFDLTRPLIFLAGAGHQWCPCPLLKKIYLVIIPYMFPNCEGPLFGWDSIL